jgi:RES domain-containing protein
MSVRHGGTSARDTTRLVVRARIHGGRFNPPGSFPVLYLCRTRPCVVAELKRLGERQALTIEDLLPREIYEFDIALDRTLDLTDAAARLAVGVGLDVLIGPDWTVCNELGVTAHALGMQAIHSASATGTDDVLAVFVKNVGLGRLAPQLVEMWRSLSDVSP